MSCHSFDIQCAKDTGSLLAATIYKNFQFWLDLHEANDKHFYEDRYWVYNSARALSELFEYASEGQIKRAIKKLLDKGYLIKRDFNKMGYDRTNWYADAKKNPEITDRSKTTNHSAGNDRPIPDSNTDSKNNKKTLQKSEELDLEPDKPSFDAVFEKLWKEIYKIIPESKKTYASKKLTRQRIKKITTRKKDRIPISRIAHAVLHYYNSPEQKKENRKFFKAPQYVIGDELFLGFIERGKFETGAKVEKTDNRSVWASRRAIYDKTGKFDAQWVKGSIHNTPKEIWSYFPEEDWQTIGFIKKDLS